MEGRIFDESGLERRVIWDDGGRSTDALAGGGWRRTIGLTVQDAQSALAIVGRSDMAPWRRGAWPVRWPTNMD